MDDPEVPKYLYKVISEQQWEESQKREDIVLAPMDHHFIHFATEQQVSHVTKKFWENKNYIILKVETHKLKGRLVYETNPGGMVKYYHLYDGKIPRDTVVETTLVKS